MENDEAMFYAAEILVELRASTLWVMSTGQCVKKANESGFVLLGSTATQRS